MVSKHDTFHRTHHVQQASGESSAVTGKNKSKRRSRKPRPRSFSEDSLETTSSSSSHDTAQQRQHEGGSRNSQRRRGRRQGQQQHRNRQQTSPSSRPRRKRSKKISLSQLDSTELSPDQQDRHVALDCEMVGVGHGGHRSAVARVCILNWHGDVLLDAFVKTDEEVTDYRTFVSGVREEDLKSDSALNLEDCREIVQEFIRDKVLIGHALKNDLQALRIMHPWYDTRDTAKYEPFMKTRSESDQTLWPRKLKELAKEKLRVDIQHEGEEHSPVEDATAALNLYKLVRRKWEKVMEYKLNKTKEIEAMRPNNAADESGPLQ